MFSIEKPNIRVLKNRDFGTTGYIVCSYDPANRRIFQASTGDHMRFSWDHTGVQLPEHPACSLPEFAIQVGQPEYGSNYMF